METVIAEILRPVVKILADHVTNKLRYLISYTKYLQKMREIFEVLFKKRDEVIEHIDKYNIIDSETPEDVKDWLNAVEKAIDDAVKVIPSDNIGCFDIRRRYKVGKDASNAAKTVHDLINENPGTSWDRIRIPHGHVGASTSAPAPLSGGETKSDYDSRDKPFNEALKLLQQNDKTQVIALCGMGGVGKTTMMERLRKHAEDKNMFNQIAKAVIGRDRDMLSVQRDIADYTGGPLTDQQGVTANADSLRIRFEKMLKDGKKILVILDDVWVKIELKNIGLWSPLPNGVKLLLTSRLEGICNQIAADVLSVIEVVKVEALVEEEARKLFFQSIGLEVVDGDLYDIGCGIVKKCGCLPLAIKIIAGTLLHKEKSEWVCTLECLKNKDLTDDLKGIIEVSYQALGKEEREILLLCGLYPEDSNVPIEDLTRYAWGLGLVKKTPTFMYARGKIEKWVSNLKSANLLMNSDDDESGCVKMHDIVLAFVVDSVSKGEEEWIIDHGDRSNWNGVRMSESCKRISLSCRGRSEFPDDFKFPNLSVLKLIHGDDSLRFPPDFHEEMKEIKVIGYERMKYPLLPTLSQYSPNLRTLCLNKCSLSRDYSCIGNLISLEVLSFAKSVIGKLPSTFRNLKKLRLLDLTDCFDLVIDDGILGNLGSLEELYVGVRDAEKGISLTNCNYEELAKISDNLFALEIVFQSQSPAILFEKLERFKISVGHPSKDGKYIIWESDEVSYQNTLMLVTSKDRLMKSRINKLFEKTERLYLEIDGMEHLEDVNVHPPSSSSFGNLRFLAVAECGKSRYLFTLNVAKALSRLENLSIAKCPVMESIIHIEGNGAQTITFPKLTVLYLKDLPELSSLCNNVNEIQLPHLLGLGLVGLPKFTSIYPKNELATSSFLSKEVVITKLEQLYIEDMENLEEIWPFEYSTSEGVITSMLTSIEVKRCDRLLNLFPSNFTPLLSHLEELKVEKCSAIKTLINMDTEGSIMLRRIKVRECESLVNLFPSNPMALLHHLEELKVKKCSAIKTLINMDTEGSIMLRRIEVRACESLVNLFPSNPMALLHHLEELKVEKCSAIKTLINMDTEGSIMLRRIEVRACESLVNLFPSNPMALLHHLEELKVEKCSAIKTLINMDTEGSIMLRRIEVRACESLVNLFPSNPMALLHHLEELEVVFCASIETLFDIDMHRVSEIEEGSSMLKRIRVSNLGKLREIWKVTGFNDDDITVIGGFQAIESILVKSCKSFENVFTPANANFDMRALMNVQIVDSGEWRRNSGLEIDRIKEEKEEEEFDEEEEEVEEEEEISGVGDNVLNVAFPSCFNHNFHHLHNIYLESWKGVEVVFEIESGSSKELAKTQQQLLLPYLKDIYLEDMKKMSHVWKCNWNEFLILQKQPFRSLTTVQLGGCNKIKYLFSPLMVKLLSNLKKINIYSCHCMEEVVSNMDDINDEEIPISTSSSSSSSSIFQTTGTLFPHLDSLSLDFLHNLKRIGGGGNESSMTTSIKVSQVDVVPWSLCQYSRVIKISQCHALSSVIPSYALGQMKKLEVLIIDECISMIEVFETEGINSIVGHGSNNVAKREESSGTDPPTLETPRLRIINNVPQLLNLKEVHIDGCELLQHVFTFSALESLKQLEKLKISRCEAMKVIVKEENGEQTNKDVVFPRLKSIKLYDLPNLEGFFLGMNNFLWESLESVKILRCPGISCEIRLFTTGRSTAPKLNFIHIDSGKYSPEQWLNFHVTTTNLDQTRRSRRLCVATSEGKPWSFHNIIEIYATYQHYVKHIIPSNELLQLQKLEKIQVKECDLVEEVFEVALEGTNNGFNESLTAVEIPNLREVELTWLRNLKCIWKSNQSAVLQFPNLTRLSIYTCDSLKHVFTSSMAGSVPQLQELHLERCDSLEVIVKDEEDEECDGKVNESTLPCLKSLKLKLLSSLKGFYLGQQAFSLPLLDTLDICKCPALTVLTKGHLNTPKLNAIKSEFGWVYVREDLNSVINTGQQEGF